MEGRMCSVVGIARHEMWFQIEETGEFVGCTRASLSNLMKLDNFKVLDSLSQRMSKQSDTEGATDNSLNENTSIDNIDSFSNVVQSFAVMWSTEHDELLIEVGSAVCITVTGLMF